MQTKTQVSLKPFNTFGIEAFTENMFILETSEDVKDVFNEYTDWLIIGGGSNILLSKPKYKSVLLNRIKGIQVVEEDSVEVIVSSGSGVHWHELVLWALSRNYGGLENLSLIPGTVGAAPIQNIGAYGVELKDVLVGVKYYSFTEQSSVFLSPEECRFGYRNSIFKNEWKNKGFISEIYLRLTKTNHQINTEYLALSRYLDEQGWENPSIHQVSEAVIAIRQSKLPDWHEIGNAGSFFKNPVIPKSHYENLAMNHTNVPFYPVDESNVKVPAAWLIQEAGFKGKRIGQVGSYKKQPLVLVNYGGGTADDILRLKDRIQTGVRNRFGIELVPEVTVV